MQYIVMLIMVIAMAALDFLTGIIKAYILKDISSSKMRTGGLLKVCEVLVMLMGCGIEVGTSMLGQYYNAPELGELAGSVTAIAICVYLTVMECISILENYVAINPKAHWAASLLSHLRIWEKEGDK